MFSLAFFIFCIIYSIKKIKILKKFLVCYRNGFCRCSSISYLLLLFVCCGQGDQNDCSTSSYTDMCHILDRSIIQQIVADLEVCYFLCFFLKESLFFILLQIREIFCHIIYRNLRKHGKFSLIEQNIFISRSFIFSAMSYR